MITRLITFKSELFLLNTILCASLIFFVSCKKPSPEPQSNDYIYLQIKQDLATEQGKLTSQQNKLNELNSKVKNADIQSNEVKLLRAKMDYAYNEVAKTKQVVKYLESKLLTREALVRQEYLSAFNHEEEWNNTEELERFKKSEIRQKKINSTGKDKSPSSPEMNKTSKQEYSSETGSEEE